MWINYCTFPSKKWNLCLNIVFRGVVLGVCRGFRIWPVSSKGETWNSALHKNEGGSLSSLWCVAIFEQAIKRCFRILTMPYGSTSTKTHSLFEKNLTKFYHLFLQDCMISCKMKILQFEAEKYSVGKKTNYYHFFSTNTWLCSPRLSN